MGDRACVDMALMLVPGEGLLTGSFSRGLFLVHSECIPGEAGYINSREFRVNAVRFCFISYCMAVSKMAGLSWVVGLEGPSNCVAC
jgi:3-dehydroquinate synthase class II